MWAEWVQLRGKICAEHRALASNPAAAPPLVAQKLLVTGEDRRHGLHSGFDVRAIARALWRWVTSRRREGASTIEQQLVRVLTGRYERSLVRKIREILLASLVAEAFPKHALPSVYLRVGYYGWRMNGFEQACGRLGLPGASLSLRDAASLVARLKYPEPRTPPPFRTEQIRCREDYLTRLYRHHLEDGTYDHLEPVKIGKAVHGRSPAVGTSGAVPSA